MSYHNCTGSDLNRQGRQDQPTNQTELSGQTLSQQRGFPACNKSSQATKKLYQKPQSCAKGLTTEASRNESLNHSESDYLAIRSDKSDELQRIVSDFLSRAVMCGDDRSFWPCYRPAGSSEPWKTAKNLVLTADQAAELCLEKGTNWAIRFRYRLRVGVFDLDNHDAINWTREDPRLRRLIATAEAAGCGASLIPSPRGLHLWIVAPEALNKVRMHWLLCELAHRAGLDPDDSAQRIDLFPNAREGGFHFDPRTAPHCAAIRLPGQLAPVPGDGFADPSLIWRDLCFQLEVASAGEAWDELLAASDVRRRAWQTEQRNRRRRQRQARTVGAGSVKAERLVAEAVWTASGQSNIHIGSLATAGWLYGSRDTESLSAFIERHARQAPGFDRFASDETKRQLSARAMDWAKCCLRHPPQGGGSSPAPSKDASRNIRLRNQTSLKLIHAAWKAAQKDGLAAARLSQRAISRVTRLHRNTLGKLSFQWADLVKAALRKPCPAPPEAAGTHPLSKGLIPETSAPADSPPLDRICLSPPCPASNAPPPDRNLSRPPSELDRTIQPTKFVSEKLPEFVSEKRRREREELARWLEDRQPSPSPAPPPPSPPVGCRVLVDRGFAGWTACRVLASEVGRWLFEIVSDGRICSATPAAGIWKPL